MTRGLFLLLLLTGCYGSPPSSPSIDTVNWQRYTSENCGFSVGYPDVYDLEPHHQGRDLIMRQDGYPVVAISVSKRGEAEQRGLWARHEPAGLAELAGHSGHRYHYDHCDGLICMRTVSLVAALGDGRFLALDFRTDQTRLDPLQEHILQSLSLDEN